MITLPQVGEVVQIVHLRGDLRVFRSEALGCGHHLPQRFDADVPGRVQAGRCGLLGAVGDHIALVILFRQPADQLASRLITRKNEHAEPFAAI